VSTETAASGVAQEGASSCDPGGWKGVWSMNLVVGTGGHSEDASQQPLGCGERQSVRLEAISRRKSVCALTLSALASGRALFPAG